jgi:tetratricopeptide (TPR) repeat protein
MMNRLSDNHRTVFVCVFLVITAVAIYWQVNHCDFTNYDDNEYVTENSYVKNGITTGGIRWALTTIHTGYWHPLTWVSYMLDYELFKLNSTGYHMVNLLFHIANSLLLFLILHRMTKFLWRSAFVAAIFAIHPLHVESVAWVAERKDVLSTFFWMLTMGAYAFYVERRELKRYLLTLLFFSLGLMAKPMVVTLPFVLLLLDYWPLRRLTRGKPSIDMHTQSEESLNAQGKKKERVRNIQKPKQAGKTAKHNQQQPTIGHVILEKVPFFVLSLALSIVTYIAQQKSGAMGSLQSYPLSARIANAIVSYCGYIGKIVWPENLAVLYPYPGRLPTWEVIGAVLFLIITTYLIIWTAKRYPYLTTGWLWYLGTLVPVIGIVQVGEQAMADRYTYVPIIGVLIMVAWGVPELMKKWRRRNAALATLAVIILCILSFVSRKQVQYWQNSITLFTHAIDVTTNNYTAHSNLGHSLLTQGKFEEAIHHYSEALRICPNCYEENNNLGIALQEQGRVEEAIDHYTKSIGLNPNYIKAYVNLGEALASQGKFTEAMAVFSKALQIKPDSGEVHYNVGTMLLSRGDFGGAIYHFREAIRIKPDYAKAYNNLGHALFLQGGIDEAIRSFQQALLLKPDYTLAQKNLEDALAQQMRNQ